MYTISGTEIFFNIERGFPMKKSAHPLEVGAISHFMPDNGNPFDPIVRYGLSVTQFCNWDIPMFTKENAEKLVKQAKSAKVRVNSLWCGYSGPRVWNFIEGPATLGFVPPEYRKQRVIELKKGADFDARCSIPAVITHCGFIPENPGDPLYAPTRDAIGEVAGYCKKLGVEFWFETGQETPVTLLRMIQDLGLPNLGINFDTGNVILYGKANPVDALDVFGQYVKCIHAKDALYPTDGRNLGKEVRVGTGRARYAVLVPKLYKLGYNGDLVIEREISGEQQKRDIMRTIVYLRKLADKAIAKGR